MSPRDDTDHRIGDLASAQHGPIAHRQLLALGLTHEQIAYRLRVGRLIREYREVYLVGHTALNREGRWMAAVLTCGPRAVLSHRDAAAHWGLAPAKGSRTHVTRPSSSGRAPDARRIALHRVGTLQPWETTIHDNIPITTVARTLLDLAADLRPRALEDVITQSNRLGRFDLVAARRCLETHPRQHGAPALRRIIAHLQTAAPADTRSPLEVAFLQLCDDHHLPPPQANTTLAGFLVDFHWPGTTLVVETDGFAYHATPTAFEADRARDQALTLAGYTVVRFTYNQVTREPAECAARLHRLLA
jgi:predicted transcriptional regulator of viral defense system